MRLTEEQRWLIEMVIFCSPRCCAVELPRPGCLAERLEYLGCLKILKEVIDG